MNTAPSPAPPDRRTALRVVFPPHRRPQFETSEGPYPIVDASPGGLRLRVGDLGRLHPGAALAGAVLLPGMDAPCPAAGHVRWVASTEVAVALDVRSLPFDALMGAIASQRDRADDN